MIVLGFDTATSATAVALALADGTVHELRDDPREGEHPGHATHLLPFAAELLARAGLGWSAVERVAVGVGPGRFTGLRVGIATARALARALGAELAAVSSSHALARGAAAAHEEQPLLTVIDARRGELFASAFAPAGAAAGAPAVDFAKPLRADELAAAVATAAELAPAGAGCVAVGDGAVRYRTQLEAAGAHVPADGDAAHLIRARATCAIAAAGSPSTPAEVVPDYRREADAARVRASQASAGRA